MSTNEKIRQREKPCAAAMPVLTECRCGERRASPWKIAAPYLIDVKQFIQCANIRPRHKQFGIDDQVDVQRRSLAAKLKLLDCPVMPRTFPVHAVNPHVGVYEYAPAAVVACEISDDHGEDWLSLRRDRAGSS